MAKYLFHGSYTKKGLKGLLKDGGSARKEATEQMFKSMGGELEAYYFAFGENDFYVIADLPDSVTGVAGALAVNASGSVKVQTTVLITPEEVDAATKRTVKYRAPGK